MTKSTVTAKCSHCGNPLPPNHSGPCPKCGKEGKAINATREETFHVSESVSRQSTREFYKKNPVAKLVVILITVASALIGLFLGGSMGVLASLVFGALSYFISPRAITKVREIRHG